MAASTRSCLLWLSLGKGRACISPLLCGSEVSQSRPRSRTSSPSFRSMTLWRRSRSNLAPCRCSRGQMASSMERPWSTCSRGSPLRKPAKRCTANFWAPARSKSLTTPCLGWGTALQCRHLQGILLLSVRRRRSTCILARVPPKCESAVMRLLFGRIPSAPPRHLLAKQRTMNIEHFGIFLQSLSLKACQQAWPVGGEEEI
mmetsp:Transcript_20047/g.53570  ORF Transcript_20047/g.53570 Transcript_20047/m.53570 type:complete len:201 (-) Transcript_20047:278-880(-)